MTKKTIRITLSADDVGLILRGLECTTSEDDDADSTADNAKAEKLARRLWEAAHEQAGVVFAYAFGRDFEIAKEYFEKTTDQKEVP